MNAIPLVNINPQDQASGPGSVMLKTGGHSSSTNFEDMIGKAAGTPSAEASPMHEETADGRTNEFSELLQLLNILFGNQADGSSASLDNLSENLSGFNTADQQSEKASTPSKAFEGFISEIQNLLAMLQGLFQGISTDSQAVAQTNTQGGPGSATELISQDAAQQAAVPAQMVTGQAGDAPISIAPGISLTSDTITQDSGPRAGYNADETTQDTISNQEEGAKTNGTPATTTTANQPSQPTAITPRYQGERHVEYISISYVKSHQDATGSQTSVHDVSVEGRSGDNPSASSPSPATQTDDLIQMDIKKAFISSKDMGNDMETEIDILTGSLRTEAGKDADPDTFQFKRIHITGDKNGLEAYSIQTSADTMSGTNPRQQNGTPIGQDNLGLNYGFSGQITSQDLDSGTMNHNDSNSQNGHDNIYHPPIHTHTVSAAEQTGNFVKVDETLGKNVASQIADGISQAVKMNKNRAVLHLRPPELGSVKISITLDHNNHIQASFVTDHPETRHILEANIQHLKDSLAQNGFSLGQVNVDVGGNAFANSGNNHHDNQLTPFGDPRMWLGDDFQDNIETDGVQRGTITNSDGMHVII